MVCIYCGGKTDVGNSRLQKRTNKVWRRRRCLTCNAVFTSLEHIQYETALAVQDPTSHNVRPLERDELFLSLYEACRHRRNAVADAAALTDTILGKLLHAERKHASIQRADIIRTAHEALRHLDSAAFVQYNAFHPLPKEVKS